MMLVKKIGREDAEELENATSTTALYIGKDTWQVWLSKNGYFILVPFFGGEVSNGEIYYCQSREDVVKLLKQFYVFKKDPTLQIYDKLDRLVR
jgi:exopolysaccharide biosynthesis protein